LKGLFREWLEDFRLPSEYIREITPVSSICARCGQRFPVVRDEFGRKTYQLILSCPNCEAKINRHDNSAQLSAEKLKEAVEKEGHFAEWYHSPKIT